MLKHCLPGQVPAGDTSHVFLHIGKEPEDQYFRLSPFAPTEGLIIPGGAGHVAPSVWAGYNFCKRITAGYNTKVFKDPRKTYVGIGAKLVRHDDRVVGIDRTDEQYLYRGKSINYVQARWAIYLPLYTQYILMRCRDEVAELDALVKATEPHDVYLYDYPNSTTDYHNAMAAMSYSYLLVDLLNRRSTGVLPRNLGDVPDVQPQPQPPNSAA